MIFLSRKRTLIAGIFVAAAFAGGFPAKGQTAGTEPGCSSEESRKLAFLEGEWKVESRFRISAEPEKWESTNAASSISALFPGCLWQEKFSGVREGRPLEMAGLFGFSNVYERFQHTWAHSLHGMLTAYDGVFEDGLLVFETAIRIQGRDLRFRKTILRSGAGFEVRNSRSMDEGKTWDVTWILKYSRSQPPAPREQTSPKTGRYVRL